MELPVERLELVAVDLDNLAVVAVVVAAGNMVGGRPVVPASTAVDERQSSLDDSG